MVGGPTEKKKGTHSYLNFCQITEYRTSIAVNTLKHSHQHDSTNPLSLCTVPRLKPPVAMCASSSTLCCKSQSPLKISFLVNTHETENTSRGLQLIMPNRTYFNPCSAQRETRIQ